MLDKERHLLFSLNAIDEMQDKFGGFDRLDTVLSGKDSIKNLRWLLTVLLNEGAADDEEPLTEKQVGKLIHTGNFADVKAAIFKSFSMGNNGTPEPPERDEEEEDDEEDIEKRNSGQGIIDLARLLYIGVTLLRWSEAEVWRMTPYKILTLFKIHREFNRIVSSPFRKKLILTTCWEGYKWRKKSRSKHQSTLQAKKSIAPLALT